MQVQTDHVAEFLDELLVAAELDGRRPRVSPISRSRSVFDIDAVKVCRRRQRFAQQRLAGLADARRSGRPPQYRRRQRPAIVKAACQPPETSSRWSVRRLAQQLHKQVGISKSQLHKLLPEMDLQPQRFEMWLNSQGSSRLRGQGNRHDRLVLTGPPKCAGAVG